MHHSEMQHSEMHHSEMHHSEMQHSEMQASENFIIGFALLRNGDILGTESIIDPLVSNDWKKNQVVII